MIKIFLFAILILQIDIFSEQETEIDSLANLVMSKTDTEKLKLYFKLAEISQDFSLQKGFDYSSKALSLSRELKDSSSSARALVLVCFYNFLQNKVLKSSKCLTEALTIYRKLSDSVGVATVYLNRGLIKWRNGELDSALINYEYAQKLFKNSSDTKGIASTLNYIGLIYWKFGNYPLALSNLLSSLKLKNEIGNKYEIALTLNNIAKLYNELNKFDKAIFYSIKAFEFSKTIHNKYILGRVLNNLGLSYAGLKQYKRALISMQKAKEVKLLLDDKIGLGFVYQDIGKIYKEIGNSNEELNYYNKSLTVREETRDNYGISSLLIAIAQRQLENNNYKVAYQSMLRGKRIAENLSAKNLLKEYFKLFAEFYAKKSLFKKAYLYSTKYLLLRDTLFNDSNIEKIIKMDSKYQVSEINKELEILKQRDKIQRLELQRQESWRTSLIFISIILFLFATLVYGRSRARKKATAILAKSNTELINLNIQLRESQEALKELNNTKDKFFSIIAHDLKNPFNSIFGFYNLLIEEFDNLSDEEKLDYITSMGVSIQNSYSLLENLLQWSRSQMGAINIKKEKLELNTLCSSIINETFSLAKNKNIKITKNCTANLYVTADKFMIEIVIRNLLTNAVKFTNENGIILLSAKPLNDFIVEITIEDDGVGIEEDLLENLFKISKNQSTLGTAKETGTGLGLIICKEFVEKNDGKLSVKSKKGEGSKFIFTLPRLQ